MTTALRRAPVDRSADRWVALAAMVAALAFVIATVVSLALPDHARRGFWLPLHLMLAGAASTAVAGVMPFFVAAFAAAPPAPFVLRAAAVAAVASGAIAVAIGVVAGLTPVSVVGGSVFIVGFATTVAAAVLPTRHSLGASRGLVTRAYVAAVVMVIAGAVVATLHLAGWEPIGAAWPRVKVAHAWLNVFGFTSLTIATTLLHFFPTVVGARILGGRSSRATIAGLVLGPPVVAVGVVAEMDAVARVGAVASIAGAGALAVYAVLVWRRRATWTTDAAWHRFAIGGLVSAIAWFTVGAALAAGRVVLVGADPSAWSLDLVGAPLVAGWIGLSLLASVTHLVPAVGPGDHAAHARQRQRLGWGATPRLALLNLGVAALALGALVPGPELRVIGVALVAVAVACTGLLILAAVGLGMRPTAGAR